MTELEKALSLANRILDRTNADPDDDLAVLARQLVRQAGGFSWLIEAGDPPHYWDGRSVDSYTSDPYQAIRFARFEDAEAVRCCLIECGVHWKSAEHRFGAIKNG